MAWMFLKPSKKDRAAIGKRAKLYRDGLHDRITQGWMTPQLAGRLMDAYLDGLQDVAGALTQPPSGAKWDDVLSAVDRSALVTSLDPNFHNNLIAASNLKPADIA